jgi:TolB-like protein/Flp pilus assembly protein TadD
VNPEILRKYIQDIRKVLGDRPDEPMFIETVTKRGYRFVAPVVDGEAPEASPAPQTSIETRAVDSVEITDLRLPLPSSKKRAYRLAIASLLVVALAVATTAYFWFGRSRARGPAFRDASIAVLPFVDMSPARDQEYFSDGLSEELINNLAKVPGIRVVARSSSFQFKGKNEDLRTVGRKLGVAHVLEGSLRREDNRMRITAELIAADNGFEVWSGTYDREVSHLIATQDEIAGAVTVALRAKLLSSDRAAILGTSRMTNAEAYQAYLQGEYFRARGQSKRDLEAALSYADQAISLDSNYAPAWAQRATLLERLAAIGLMPSPEGFRRARESADKAIALDPGLATGYLALALVQIDHDWDWQSADISLKKAGQLQPGSAAVLGMQAYLARNQGHLEEAVGLYMQAIALDPLRANFHLALGDKLYDLGRYGEAKAALEKAQELNPQLSALHLTRGKIFFSEGRPREALEEMEEENGEWEKLSGEALAYFALGRLGDSDKALKKLIATHQNDSAYQVAEVYAYRGETDKAFQWLDRAFRQRDPGMPELKTNRLMENLRQDSRYAELLKKMRLPAE